MLLEGGARGLAEPPRLLRIAGKIVDHLSQARRVSARDDDSASVRDDQPRDVTIG